MNNGIADTVRALMSDVLAVDAAAIGDDAGMDSLPEWDSAAHINLVMALEEQFGVSFDVSEMESMTTFADLLAVLEAKL